MSLLQQIYCKDNNTCFSIPLEKRKIAKKILGQIIFLLFIILILTACILFPLWIVNLFISGAPKASAITTYSHPGIPATKTSNLNVNLFEIVMPYLQIAFAWVMLLCLAYILMSLIIQCYYYRYYFYDLGQDEITIKKGVMSRREITIPYSKIQNVFVDQDMLDRVFGLYDIHLETAGFGSGYIAHIDGVNQVNSEKLRELIMLKTKKQTAGKEI